MKRSLVLKTRKLNQVKKRIIKKVADRKAPIRKDLTKKKVIVFDSDSENSKQQVPVTLSSGIFTNESFEELSLKAVSKGSAPLHPWLLARLTAEQYLKATAIQRNALLPALLGKDLMIRCETGSGKTLAFLIPSINALAHQPQIERSDGTRVLLLAPTRELVNQTIMTASKLASCFPFIVTSSITGGEKKKSEKARLRKGVTFLGATVGRICDHLDSTCSFSLVNLQTLILDEADRLLDMGFEQKLRWMYHKLKEMAKSKSFQSILVSATLSPSVRQLADFLLNDEAAWVGEGIDQEEEEHKQQEAYQLPANLKQLFVEVTLKQRFALIAALVLDKSKTGKICVFFSNRESVEFHAMMLRAGRWPNASLFSSRASRADKSSSELPPPELLSEAKRVFREIAAHKKSKQMKSGGQESEQDDESEDETEKVAEETARISGLLGEYLIPSDVSIFKLHGSLPQMDRIGYLNDFNKRSSKAVLLTTDVAARGLNMEGVDWIVQVDPAQDIQEYIHRVGRTARIGKPGNALCFLLPHEMGFVERLRDCGVHIRGVPELQLEQSLSSEYLPLELKPQRIQNVPSFLNSFLSRQVSADIDLLHAARRAFSKSLQAYRCYSKDLKSFFDVKALHLGQLASSFLLSESPTLIGLKCRKGVVAAAVREMRQDDKKSKADNQKMNHFSAHKTSINKGVGLKKITKGLIQRNFKEKKHKKKDQRIPEEKNTKINDLVAQAMTKWLK